MRHPDWIRDELGFRQEGDDPVGLMCSGEGKKRRSKANKGMGSESGRLAAEFTLQPDEEPCRKTAEQGKREVILCKTVDELFYHVVNP